jgi:hypothetical protein
MFPNLSQADCDAIERRYQDLRNTAAHQRLAGHAPVANVRDWGLTGRQAVGTLAVFGVLIILLLQV